MNKNTDYKSCTSQKTAWSINVEETHVMHQQLQWAHMDRWIIQHRLSEAVTSIFYPEIRGTIHFVLNTTSDRDCMFISSPIHRSRRVKSSKVERASFAEAACESYSNIDAYVKVAKERLSTLICVTYRKVEEFHKLLSLITTYYSSIILGWNAELLFPNISLFIKVSISTIPASEEST